MAIATVGQVRCFKSGKPGISQLSLCAIYRLSRMGAGTMVKGTLFILGLLLLAACNDSGSSPASTLPSTEVPTNAQAWSIMYSPGMPPHPTPQIGGGWYFDFPIAPNAVHYVLAAVSLAASVSVDASILVTTTETPVFVYNYLVKKQLRIPQRRPASSKPLQIWQTLGTRRAWRFWRFKSERI
jgi:hypothetical protein